MDPSDFAATIRDAFGPFAESDANPDGGAGYYVESEATPFHVFYGWDAQLQEYATSEDAIAAVKAWREDAETVRLHVEPLDER